MLLDTHIAIWAITDDPRLSSQARSLIESPANEVFFSVVSLWEISIKHAQARTGPNTMPVGSAAAQEIFQAAGFAMLDISASHIHALTHLPSLHSDPFDRLLLAQAFETPLRLLTRDRMMLGYGGYVLPV